MTKRKRRRDQFTRFRMYLGAAVVAVSLAFMVFHILDIWVNGMQLTHTITIYVSCIVFVALGLNWYVMGRR